MKGSYDKKRQKPMYDKPQSRAMTPPRVAARLEGKVKNVGTRPKKKGGKGRS